MTKLLAAIAVLSTLTLTARLAAADDEPTFGAKSRTTAFALSAGGTALSLGLLGVGLATENFSLVTAGAVSSLVTPSAGEIYAGKPFTWGLGMRVVSAGLLVGGAVEGLKCFGVGSNSQSSCHNDRDLAGTLLVAGAIGYAGGILYDIATAGSAVDNYNEKHHLHVAPLAARSTASGTTLGLGIGGSF